MTEQFKKWIQDNPFAGDEDLRDAEHWLRAFVREVERRTVEEMNEQVGLLTCAGEEINQEFLLPYANGIALEKTVRDFGLEEK